MARNWTQAELARYSGVSRTAISAIEIGRLVPSVAAALALAKAFECSVETLFGEERCFDDQKWCDVKPFQEVRYWKSRVGDSNVLYPVEWTAAGLIGHDGVYRDGAYHERPDAPAETTLVMASCDPAAGLLAAEYARVSGFRLIVLPRSSQQSLELLYRGLIHIAGIHFASVEEPDLNESLAKARLGPETRLVRVARWQEGLALPGQSGISSIRGALESRLRWVGREPGSGARQCLDQILGGERQPEHIAYDHRGVAQAIRCGFADAGVCLRLVSDEAGLRFLSVREEIYDLCYFASFEQDRRFKALLSILQSANLRSMMAELPGYTVEGMGELHH